MQNIDRLHGKIRIKIGVPQDAVTERKSVGQWIGSFRYNYGDVCVIDASTAISMIEARPQRATFLAGLFVLPGGMHNQDEKRTIEDLTKEVVEIKSLEDFRKIEGAIHYQKLGPDGNPVNMTRTFPEAYKVAFGKDWAPETPAKKAG